MNLNFMDNYRFLLFIVSTFAIVTNVSCGPLLTSYLPASMQALAYYIDLLQYEPLATTTIEPPFSVSLDEGVAESNATTASTTITTMTTTTKRPTNRPINQTSGWWKPPDWWNQPSTTTTTTTPRPVTVPTPPHRPGIFAPPQSPHVRQTNKNPEGLELFESLGSDPGAFDDLAFTLIRDIQTEMNHDEFTNDVESLDNFLRLYDDNYGRATYDAAAAMDRWSTTSTSGKKRVPPTKPYVEFLLVYDLLKRDAKAANLSKYEGYSEELLKDLFELSHVSAERQLYTLFKKMLDKGDISRSDVVSRVQGIMKDLGNPNSITAKSLRYIPPLMFLP